MKIYVDIEELVNNEAPHGSGINYNYENFHQNGERVTFCNAFDLMDENGFYEAAIPFKVIVDRFNGVKIIFRGLNGHGRYLTNKYALREYLEDVYSDFIHSAIARYSLEEMFK